jgi:hypothetical protein
MKTTKHTCNGPVFGKLTPGCPRCDELKSGAPVREWASTRNARFEASRREAVRSHDCKKSNCGPVCTYGDW